MLLAKMFLVPVVGSIKLYLIYKPIYVNLFYVLFDSSHYPDLGNNFKIDIIAPILCTILYSSA